MSTRKHFKLKRLKTVCEVEARKKDQILVFLRRGYHNGNIWKYLCRLHFALFCMDSKKTSCLKNSILFYVGFNPRCIRTLPHSELKNIRRVKQTVSNGVHVTLLQLHYLISFSLSLKRLLVEINFCSLDITD